MDITSPSTSTRDPGGRFGRGNQSSRGRPKGARSKLGEQFVADLLENWKLYGKQVIDNVRLDDPSTYLKVVGNLLPREAIVQMTTDPIALCESTEDVIDMLFDNHDGDPRELLDQLETFREMILARLADKAEAMPLLLEHSTTMPSSGVVSDKT